VEIRKRRGAVIWWGVGIAAYLALIIAIAPDLAPEFGNLNLQDIPIYEAFGITESISSPANLIGVYVAFVPLVIATYGVITGTAALVGEEDDGTLETILALPIPRWQIVVAKAIGIAAALLGVIVIGFVGYLVAFPLVASELDADFGLGELFASSIESWPLGLLFAMLSLFLGAYLPRRAVATGVSLAFLIGSYLFNNLAQAAGPLENARPFLPFYYSQSGDVLQGNWDWGLFLVPVGIAMLFLGLAILSFQRRNVTVGEWPWQKRLQKPA
jgi:ABC-2 type transport system permease protein